MSGTTPAEREDLRRSVRELLAAHADESARTAAIESELGHDPALWSRLADLGACSLAIGEDCGGAGFGLVEQSVVLEELGATLAPTPFLGSVVLAAGAIEASGDAGAREAFLPGLADGSTHGALALVEADGLWRHSGFTTRAVLGEDGWQVTGAKTLVVDGAGADLVVVAAETVYGPTLFVVTDITAVEQVPLHTLDLTRRMAALTFTGTPAVPVEPVGGAEPVLERLLDRAMAAVAAEQVGAARACLAASVAYAKSRVQFGRQIGSFQAVKHRCADMLVRVQLASAAADEAAAAGDGEPDRAPFEIAAGVAHHVCSESLMSVAAENIQVHGGIGFTWEHPAHLYFRRAKADQLLFGGPSVTDERLLARALA